MNESQKKEFIVLLEANKQMISRICRGYAIDKEDRKDLFQEVVFNLWKSLPSFQGKSSIGTWIYRVQLLPTNEKLFAGRKSQCILQFY